MHTEGYTTTHTLIAYCTCTKFNGPPCFEQNFIKFVKKCWWPSLYRDVKTYVRACQHCKSKRPAQPTPTGNAQFWDSLSLDFMIKLPLSIKGNYDAVAFFVETISKYVRVVPIPKAINGTQFATVFHNTIFRHYGIPKTLLTAKSVAFTADL
jgi:hypothetical protein